MIPEIVIVSVLVVLLLSVLISTTRQSIILFRSESHEKVKLKKVESEDRSSSAEAAANTDII